MERSSAIPEAVARFREEYRREVLPKNYSGIRHLIISNSIGLGTMALCLSRLENVRWWEWMIVPAGFLIGNYGEYHFHRGPMHHKTKGLEAGFLRHTVRHHHFYRHDAMAAESTQDYHMVLFPWWFLVVVIVVFGVPLALAAGFTVSSNAGWLLLFTITAYYLNYEWLHLAYHLPEDSWLRKLPFMNMLRQMHTRHHDPTLMHRWNFNITYPVFDWIYGTWKRGQES